MNRRRRAIDPLLLLSLILLTPAYVAARAGGGEGFNGGGGGGGGGGHGGGGGGGGGINLLIDLIIFCLRNPAIGVPLLIVVIVAVIYFQMSSNGNQQSGANFISRNPPMTPGVEPTGVIRSHDPAFDPGAFCNRVGAGFLKLQSAWCAQDLQEVRAFISDGIRERFSLQFAEQQTDGYRDRMDSVGIDQIHIISARSDEIYDELSVRIVAHAADYKISARDGRPINGVAPLQPFAEIWSFLRRRGSTTITGKPGLLEGNCPNCGAPVAMNESANCANCHALLRSGQYDWVLCEITQESEWQPTDGIAAPGLARLRQLDPDLNVQSLEDRASVIFWRKSAADRIGKLDPMFKVTSPAYGQTYAARLKPPTSGLRTYYGQCAVGSVTVLGFTTVADTQQAIVQIHWSGMKLAAAAAGIAPRVIEPNLPHHTLFILMRKAAAKTDVAKGISSAHCPNCGAPESGGTSGACEFCGTALNDGSNGWVLDNILPFNDPAAMTILNQLRV